jgi:hypothetical protein
MPDDNTTAQATEDSVETPETTQDSAEHQEEVEETAEDTAENNETQAEDSGGAPEAEEEELDPLLKAKKHADRKITELGHTVSAKEQALVAAVKRSPDLLIEMYDPQSEMYDLALANKIRETQPEVYQKADAIYRQRATSTPAPQTDIDSIVEAKIREREERQEKQGALDEFRKTLGYSEADFAIISPGVVSVAETIRRNNPDIPMEAALRSAFVGLYPDDYNKSVIKSVALNASKKKALIGTAGGGGGSDFSSSNKFKWTDEERIALKTSGLTEERYLKLVHNIT